MNVRLEAPIFTIPEENLICIYDTSSRKALINGIADAKSFFEEPELIEITDRVLCVLNAMTDDEYATITFHPAYHGNDDENEVEV